MKPKAKEKSVMTTVHFKLPSKDVKLLKKIALLNKVSLDVVVSILVTLELMKKEIKK